VVPLEAGTSEVWSCALCKMAYGREEHVFIVKTFYQTNSLVTLKKQFLRKLNRQQVVSMTQFKVPLKRYLHTHFFYSVEEFLAFKNDSIHESFFPIVLLDFAQYVYTYVKLFYVIFTVF
jgi:hypothetical protein